MVMIMMLCSDVPVMLFKGLIYRGFEVGGKSSLLIPLIMRFQISKGRDKIL
jgi:hypothetical protein